MTNDVLGEKLRAIRLARGLTLDDLATQCGVAREFIAMIERGAVSPTVDTLSRMLSALQFTMVEFFKEPIKKDQYIFAKEEFQFDGQIADIAPDAGARSPCFLRLAPYEETPVYYQVDVVFYVLYGGVGVKITPNISYAMRTDVIHIKPSERYSLVGRGGTGAELLCIPIGKGE